MRKFIQAVTLVALGGVLVLGLSRCGGDSSSPDTGPVKKPDTGVVAPGLDAGGGECNPMCTDQTLPDCNEGTCVCNSSSCLNGQVCGTNGKCQGCTTTICNGVCCAAGQTCVANTCTTTDSCNNSCNGTTPTCVSGVCQCKTSPDSCGGGTALCVSGACCAAPCGTTTKTCCLGGQTCQADGVTCGGTCTSGVTCGTQCCNAGQNCKGAGGTCHTPDTCNDACTGTTPTCVAGVCQCTATSCGTGYTCTNNSCVPNAGTDAGAPPTATTVCGLFTAATKTTVEVDNAVVVAVDKYTSHSQSCPDPVAGGSVETFYIQDQQGSCPSQVNGVGVAVYRACKDSTLPLPNVGDIVTVTGYFTQYDSSFQIESYKSSVSLSITIVSPAPAGDGKATAGAYSPAGTPTVISDPTAQAGYANNLGVAAHPEQLGTVLTFTNVAVTDMHPFGFVDTEKADGGGYYTAGSQGFAITGGIWVMDSNIYSTCMKVADGGILTPALTNGITGVWDRYLDFYGHNGPDGGYTPTVPVLIPQSCADIQ